MRVSEQISNGSTDHPRLQKSRSDQGLHLLEPSEATAVLKPGQDSVLELKAALVQQLLWCMSCLGWDRGTPCSAHTWGPAHVTLEHLKSKQAMGGR